MSARITIARHGDAESYLDSDELGVTYEPISRSRIKNPRWRKIDKTTRRKTSRRDHEIGQANR
jgi:hypothetical protein